MDYVNFGTKVVLIRAKFGLFPLTGVISLVKLSLVISHLRDLVNEDLNMRNFALSVIVSASAVLAAPAAAAVYNVTGIANGSQGGFGFSLFHDQSNHQMSGGTIATIDAEVTNGSWNSSTGAFYMDFTAGGGSISASSMNLLESGGSFTGTDSIGYNIVGGDILMTFEGVSGITDGSYTMNFVPAQQGGSIANGVANDFSFLNLWGDHDYGNCGNSCFGVDLRMQLSEVATAPLPASALLLFAGIGGLGAMRKLRKQS
ncbi:MAG: VPLPA-CTERM sorting domain-containing protein [Pseudomonadota bacterium]